jgi:cyclase
MLKKRIIFTLLYDSGKFALSRNFRLQHVGDLSWLQRNYDFRQVSYHIDELIVLNVSRNTKQLTEFCRTLEDLTAGCFIPICAGGGVRSVSDAKALLRSGADKVIVNSSLFGQQELVQELSSLFGQQCVVASVDLKKHGNGSYHAYTENGSKLIKEPAKDALSFLNAQFVGEIYLNSIDRDGTGQGYDFAILDQLPNECSVPVILAGGVGNYQHLGAGIADPRVDAVATAHLFNFVGDGLKRAREMLLKQGALLPQWRNLDKLNLT